MQVANIKKVSDIVLDMRDGKEGVRVFLTFVCPYCHREQSWAFNDNGMRKKTHCCKCKREVLVDVHGYFAREWYSPAGGKKVARSKKRKSCRKPSRRSSR